MIPESTLGAPWYWLSLLGWSVLVLGAASLATARFARRFVALRYQIHCTGILAALSLVPLLLFVNPETTIWSLGSPHLAPQIPTEIRASFSPSLEESGTSQAPRPDSRESAVGPVDDLVPREAGASTASVTSGFEASSDQGRPWHWLALAWAAGSLGLLLTQLAGVWRVRRLLRTADPAPASVRTQVKELARSIGLRRTPRVAASSRVPGPVLLGTWSPRVLIPSAFAQDLPPSQLRPLLLHELTHVRRGDPWVHAGVRLAKILLWPNPLVWFTAKAIARDREVLTDGEVVRRSNQRADYAEGLLRVLERMLPSTGPRISALGVADEHRDHVWQRLDYLLSPATTAYATLPGKRRALVWAAAALALFPASSFGLIGPALIDSTKPETASPQEEPLVIELPEPLPSAELLKDPVQAAAWTPARRMRAGRMYVNNVEVTKLTLKAALTPYGVSRAENRSVDDPTVSTVKARIVSSSQRDFADVRYVLDMLGDQSIGIREVSMVMAPRHEPPKPPSSYDDAVQSGVQWLLRRQRDDGLWDSGHPQTQRVGVSALALLTLLGSRSDDPRFSEAQTRATQALLATQAPDGRFGEKSFHDSMYHHAVALLALSEAHALFPSDELKLAVKKGVHFALSAQNPYRAWRYGVRDGDNDSSITGWMLIALKSAKVQGFEVTRPNLTWALDFLEAMTDPETGRTGYMQRGERPVRAAGRDTSFPPEHSESLTAESMYARILHGQNPKTTPLIEKGASLLLLKLPRWMPEAGRVDYIYWYFGTLAMFQVGGDEWSRWAKATGAALLDAQTKDGEEAGSFPAVDPWSNEGGLVYSTSLCTMAMTAFARYERVQSGK